MRITIKGQVTIPREIRNQLGFFPGTKVEFDLAVDHVRIRKVCSSAEPVSRGQRAVEAIRGTATIPMTTDKILALTRG